MDEDAIHRAKMWILLSFQVYNINHPTISSSRRRRDSSLAERKPNNT
jgi:hypothetical protein